MRRISILIFVQVCCLTNMKGQELSSIDLNFVFPDREDVIISSPVAHFSFNNHEWSVGPTMLISYGDKLDDRDGFKLTGLNIGYANFLHGKDEKWSLFHEAMLIVQRVKDEQDSQFFDTNTDSFVPVIIEQIDNSFLLSTNLGVLWNFSSKLSLKQSIGIGGSVTFRNTDSNFDSFSDTFFAQRWIMKTGISYRLN